MIHLVVALRAEARPFVEALSLEATPAGEAPFPLFVGRRARLVVSGVGRVRAAAATAYLEGRFPEQALVWGNVGVAAHRELPLGTAVVAHKVVEEASSRTWYPTLIVEPELPTATVCTVDRPVARATDDSLYEMEAAGFAATAVRCVTSERLVVVKVVSDHGVESPRELDRGRVTALVERSVGAALAHVEAVVRVVRQRTGEARSRYLVALGERFHFSVTETRRLERLSNRAAVLGLSVEEVGRLDAGSAGEFMSHLEERLDAAAGVRR